MTNQALELPEVAAIVEPHTPLPPIGTSAAELTHEKAASSAVQVEENHNIVDFVEDDPENPLNWPTWRKWVTVILVYIIQMLV